MTARYNQACICLKAFSLQGLLILRDGAYLSEQDVFLKLEGVYMTSLGKLHAVVHPVHDIQHELEDGDIQEHTADYRYFTTI